MIDLLAMLKRIEWEGWGETESVCPECMERKKAGHKPGCELKAVIDLLESGKVHLAACPTIEEMKKHFASMTPKFEKAVNDVIVFGRAEIIP